VESRSNPPDHYVSSVQRHCGSTPLSLVLSKTPEPDRRSQTTHQTLRNPGKLIVHVLLPAIVDGTDNRECFFRFRTRLEIDLAVCFVGIPWFSGVAFGLNPLGATKVIILP